MVGAIVFWAANETFLYYRDNLSTHYPVKSITPEIIRDGLPLWNPFVGGGQPLAGNPNNLTFYPTTLLYLVLPAHVAFNLHFLIHLALAWTGMRRLVRLHGVSETDARMTAWLYLLSGTTISCLVFYNLVVSAALIPWALAALIVLLETQELQDGLCLGSLCGLIGLAAEPVVIVGFAILAISLLASRFSPRTLVPIGVAIIVAVAVALPQLISYAEIAGETERAHFTYGSEGILAASLGPYRLAEMILGPVFGSVLDHSTGGYWSNQTARRWPPFFLSVMMSALIIPATLRKRTDGLLRYQIPIAIFLLLGLGRFNPFVLGLVDRFETVAVIRYPEKFALPITIAGSILIGILFRDLRSRPDRFRRMAAVGIGIGITTLLLVLFTTNLSGVASGRLLGITALQLGTLGLLLVPNRLISPSRTTFLVALVPLLIWAALLIPVDRAGYYIEPSPVAEEIGSGMPVEVAPAGIPRDVVGSRNLYRFYAYRLNPVFGLRFGIPYVLSDSPEGMHSYLSTLSNERFRAADPPSALKYLRIHGAKMSVRNEPLAMPGIRLSGAWEAWTEAILLYDIADTRPLLWEPSGLIRARSASEAAAKIESDSYDPLRDSVVPVWLDPTVDPSGHSTIRMTSQSSQRMRFEVVSERPTVAVVNQTWFSGWQARSGDRELTTFPADIDRLGIVVPAGTSVVDLSFGRSRGAIAISLLLSAAILFYSLGLVNRSRTRRAVPAR